MTDISNLANNLGLNIPENDIDVDFAETEEEQQTINSFFSDFVFFNSKMDEFKEQKKILNTEKDEIYKKLLSFCDSLNILDSKVYIPMTLAQQELFLYYGDFISTVSIKPQNITDGIKKIDLKDLNNVFETEIEKIEKEKESKKRKRTKKQQQKQEEEELKKNMDEDMNVNIDTKTSLYSILTKAVNNSIKNERTLYKRCIDIVSDKPKNIEDEKKWTSTKVNHSNPELLKKFNYNIPFKFPEEILISALRYIELKETIKEYSKDLEEWKVKKDSLTQDLPEDAEEILKLPDDDSLKDRIKKKKQKYIKHFENQDKRDIIQNYLERTKSIERGYKVAHKNPTNGQITEYIIKAKLSKRKPPLTPSIFPSLITQSIKDIERDVGLNNKEYDGNFIINDTIKELLKQKLLENIEKWKELNTKEIRVIIPDKVSNKHAFITDADKEWFKTNNISIEEYQEWERQQQENNMEEEDEEELLIN